MAKARVHLVIHGRVQGVAFRYYTVDEANRLGLVGWVRNLGSGEVEVAAEGEKAKVEELVRWCHRGPPAARVNKVDIQWEEPTGEEKRFGVAYDR